MLNFLLLQAISVCYDPILTYFECSSASTILTGFIVSNFPPTQEELEIPSWGDKIQIGSPKTLGNVLNLTFQSESQLSEFSNSHFFESLPSLINVLNLPRTVSSLPSNSFDFCRQLE
jgi:hypothetical protein